MQGLEILQTNIWIQSSHSVNGAGRCVGVKRLERVEKTLAERQTELRLKDEVRTTLATEW